MRKTKPTTLTEAQEKRLSALAAASEDTIDTSDIAELTAEVFGRATRLADVFKVRKRQIKTRRESRQP